MTSKTSSDSRPSPRPRSEPEAVETVAEPADPAGDRSKAAKRWRGPAGIARPRALILILLFVALVGAAGYFGWQARQASQLDAARAAAVASAREYAVDLSSYDYTKLESNFQKVSANSTGDFAKQYEQVSSNLTELIKQHKAVSKGTVIDAGLVRADEAGAVVLMFVDQTITNTSNPQPRIDRNRLRMSLVHQDGRWLVDDVKLM